MDQYHQKIPKWFGRELSKSADVKIIKKWDDIGEPKPFYNFAQDVKNGRYLINFPKQIAKKIRKSFKKRVRLEGEYPAILFGRKYDALSQVPENEFKRAPIINDVYIIK